MKLVNSFLIAALAFGGFACSKDSDDEVKMPDSGNTEQPGGPEQDPVAPSSRDEQFRPQIHYTPSANWINDPNGMVYVDGVWHLYYQYNPYGNNWGNMSWGHAVSTDLIHWEEKSVALVKDKWGDIFSGSAVVDKNNTAGFGAGAVVALYTGSGEHQQQCLAYSTDGGMSYTQYSGNPIIANSSLPDFRDPKVFWHEESKKWVMCLAMGWSQAVELWGSSDLKSWEKLSTFKTDSSRSNIGQWECPDLFKLPYKGGEKWVMIVSNNPGGPAGGSGTEYFVGDFNGTEFIADDLAYPLWLDYGSDNYAGVTWSNAPNGRVIMIGWMNNWNYCGNVPCNPWRSAMTLPRELSLVEVNGSPLLATNVVKELDKIAGEWKTAPNGVCSGGNAYQVKLTVDLSKKTSFKVGNDQGEYLEVEIIPSAGIINAKRNAATGKVDFNSLFSLPAISAPLNATGNELELYVYIDSSSVEIISSDGTMALTNLVFPNVPYDRVTGIENVAFRPLKTIW